MSDENESAFDELHRIVDGIDRTEDDPGGWWETSGGADFGAVKLRALEELVTRLAGADA